MVGDGGWEEKGAGYVGGKGPCAHILGIVLRLSPRPRIRDGSGR